MKAIDAMIRLRDMFTPVLRQVDSAMREHERAASTMRQSTAAMGASLQAASRAAQEHSKEIIRMGKSISSAGDSITAMSNKAAMIAAPLMAAAGAGLKLNSEFTNGMAKVSTALDTTQISLESVRKGLIGVSNQTGISVVELTQAEYQALSAGVASEKSVEFLASTMKAAKAGFSDAATTIDTVTTVLNAYGMQAESATNITDQMIAAQNFGKTTFADMGASIGNVIPVAAALNVKTEELFASIATLSKNGIRTSEAITGLKAAYSNILKPSAESIKAAAAMGMEFNAAHLQSVGWVQFLNEIKEKTGGSTQAMAQLFGSVEALNSVTVLAGKGNADLASAMMKMASSAGATEEAYRKLLTPAEQNAIAMNQLRNAAMELSQGLTPLLRSTTVLMKQLAEWLDSLTDAQREMLAYTARNIVIFVVLTGVLGRVVSGVGKVTTMFGKMAASAKTNGGWIAALTNKFPTAANAASKMASGIQLAVTAMKSGLVKMGGPLAAFNQGIVTALKHPLDAINKLKASITGIGSKLGMMSSALSAMKTAIVSNMSSVMTAVLGVMQNPLGAMGKLITSAQGAILRLVGTLQGGMVTALRAVGIALRGLFLNPIGIAIMVIVALAVAIYSNWGAIKEFFTAALTAIGDRVKQMAATFSDKFGAIWEKAQGVFARLVSLVSLAWGRIENIFGDGGGVVGKTVSFIATVLIAGLGATLNIALSIIEMFVNAACVIINGILDVFDGVITFLRGAFTGNWSLAWEGVVQIFSGIFGTIAGICETVLGGVRASINAVIGGINSISVDVPEWVPGVGGQHYQPSIPMLAGGTDSWPGGLAMIHDAGAEIVDLPRGARVYPHDKSLAMAFNAGREHQVIKRGPALATATTATTGGSRTQNNNQKTERSINITIPKFAEQIIIKETADAQEVMKYFASEIDKMAGNMA